MSCLTGAKVPRIRRDHDEAKRPDAYQQGVVRGPCLNAGADGCRYAAGQSQPSCRSECSFSKCRFLPGEFRTAASADGLETGLIPGFLGSVLKRSGQEARSELASGERFPAVSGAGQSPGLPRKLPANPPLSAVPGQAESMALMGTGGGGTTRYNRSPGWSLGEPRPSHLLALVDRHLRPP